MKVKIEQEEISTKMLNDALNAFTKVLNQHFVSDGNTILLKETEKQHKDNWVITIEIGWDKKEKA